MLARSYASIYNVILSQTTAPADVLRPSEDFKSPKWRGMGELFMFIKSAWLHVQNWALQPPTGMVWHEADLM